MSWKNMRKEDEDDDEETEQSDDNCLGFFSAVSSECTHSLAHPFNTTRTSTIYHYHIHHQPTNQQQHRAQQNRSKFFSFEQIACLLPSSIHPSTLVWGQRGKPKRILGLEILHSAVREWIHSHPFKSFLPTLHHRATTKNNDSIIFEWKGRERRNVFGFSSTKKFEALLPPFWKIPEARITTSTFQKCSILRSLKKFQKHLFISNLNGNWWERPGGFRLKMDKYSSFVRVVLVEFAKLKRRKLVIRFDSLNYFCLKAKLKGEPENFAF